MTRARSSALRDAAGWQVHDGFGRSVLAASRTVVPRTRDEMTELVAKARREGLPVTFRGSGRSYGDASLGTGALVIDGTHMNRVLDWNPQTGVLEAEAGLTIEGLWRRVIEDGYWPAVVPGTARPTMGGCVSMNIHGKNNFKAGPFGEHVLELDLLTPQGELLTCSRSQNSEIFHAVIGGLGLLGAVLRVKVKTKKVESGNMRITELVARNLGEMFDLFEQRIPHSDYLVGWVDCLSGGEGLGRGQIHQANYLRADEDPMGPEGFHVERQGLPAHILGVPKAMLWRFMQPFLNNFGVGLVNTAKYVMSKLKHENQYLQSHVAFAFLLDYVANWRLAYGDGGFIQYQIFVPDSTARDCMPEVLRMAQQARLPSYLGVFKRHRPDPFLLTHALDGWSMAMDYKVTAGNRDDLWKLTQKMTECVLQAGGKFYFAKDSVLRAADVERAYGRERLDRFLALKAKLDPEGLLRSDLGARVLGLR